MIVIGLHEIPILIRHICSIDGMSTISRDHSAFIFHGTNQSEIAGSHNLSWLQDLQCTRVIAALFQDLSEQPRWLFDSKTYGASVCLQLFIQTCGVPPQLLIDRKREGSLLESSEDRGDACKHDSCEDFIAASLERCNIGYVLQVICRLKI